MFETELPGVGRRYVPRFPAGGEFVVVVQNDGRRRTFWRERADADSEALFEATGAQAREIVEVFDDTDCHPVDEDLEKAFDDARIRWIAVDDGSPLADERIRDAGLRSRTGVSILAVQRGAKQSRTPTPTPRYGLGTPSSWWAPTRRTRRSTGRTPRSRTAVRPRHSITGGAITPRRVRWTVWPS